MGRPKKNEKDKMSYHLCVKMTNEEKLELEIAAENNGYANNSEFIRDLITREYYRSIKVGTEFEMLCNSDFDYGVY